jgi:hypothetical protein
MDMARGGEDQLAAVGAGLHDVAQGHAVEAGAGEGGAGVRHAHGEAHEALPLALCELELHLP